MRRAVAETVLEITDRFAGDNYIVRATTTDPQGKPFNDGSGVTDPEADGEVRRHRASATLTAWKRVYLEEDRMYVKGSFIAFDTVVGTDSVKVQDVTDFSPGAEVHVFDAAGSEPRTWKVASINETTKTLNLADQTGAEAQLGGPYTAARRGYVGSVSGGYYAASTTGIRSTFDDAFIEVIRLPNGSAPVPRVRFEFPAKVGDMDAYRNLYFQNQAKRNYLYLLGAQDESTIHPGRSNASLNWSYVYFAEIQRHNGDPVHVTNHELVHQWDDPLGEPNDGHDNERAHDNTDWCLLNHAAHWKFDGWHELCVQHLYKLRDAVDDI